MSEAVERILAQIAGLTAKDRAALLSRLAGEEARSARSAGGMPPRRAANRIDGAADYTIVFDGGSRGNPGPGYGSFAVSRRGGKKPRLTRLDFGRRMTNNEAEYEALIAALEALTAQVKADGSAPGQKMVEIRGDSALVIRQVEGSWKAKDARMRAFRDRVRQLLAGFGGHRLVTQAREESVRVLGH